MWRSLNLAVTSLHKNFHRLELIVIPSSMGGDAILARAKDNVSVLQNSLPQGSGRKISRSESIKKMYFLDGGPKGVYIPYFLSPEGLTKELPPNYRTIDEVLLLIKDYISIEAVLTPISTVMI